MIQKLLHQSQEQSALLPHLTGEKKKKNFLLPALSKWVTAAFLTFASLIQYETPRKGQTLPVSLNILAWAVVLGLGAWVLEPNCLDLDPALPLASSVTLDRGFDMFVIPFSHL